MINNPPLQKSDEAHLYELDKDFKELDSCTQLVINHMLENKIEVKHVRKAIETCMPAIRKELDNSKSSIFSDEELSIIYECAIADFIYLQLAKRGKVWSKDQVKTVINK